MRPYLNQALFGPIEMTSLWRPTISRHIRARHSRRISTSGSRYGYITTSSYLFKELPGYWTNSNSTATNNSNSIFNIYFNNIMVYKYVVGLNQLRWLMLRSITSFGDRISTHTKREISLAYDQLSVNNYKLEKWIYFYILNYFYIDFF